MSKYSQTLVLQFLLEYSNEHGWMPTVREISTGVEISSTSVVTYWLKKLETNNCIERGSDSQARAIRITKKGLGYLEAFAK